MIRKRQSSKWWLFFIAFFYMSIFFLKNLIFKVKRKIVKLSESDLFPHKRENLGLNVKQTDTKKCIRIFFKSLIFKVRRKTVILLKDLFPCKEKEECKVAGKTSS